MTWLDLTYLGLIWLDITWLDLTIYDLCWPDLNINMTNFSWFDSFGHDMPWQGRAGLGLGCAINFSSYHKLECRVHGGHDRSKYKKESFNQFNEDKGPPLKLNFKGGFLQLIYWGTPSCFSAIAAHPCLYWVEKLVTFRPPLHVHSDLWDTPLVEG